MAVWYHKIIRVSPDCDTDCVTLRQTGASTFSSCGRSRHRLVRETGLRAEVALPVPFEVAVERRPTRAPLPISLPWRILLPEVGSGYTASSGSSVSPTGPARPLRRHQRLSRERVRMAVRTDAHRLQSGDGAPAVAAVRGRRSPCDGGGAVATAFPS